MQFEPSPAVCCTPDLHIRMKKVLPQNSFLCGDRKTHQQLLPDLKRKGEQLSPEVTFLKRISIIFIQISNDAIYLLQFLHEFCWILMRTVSMH